MTVIDLRIKYKRATGKIEVPISNGYYGDPDYVAWVEDQLIKHMVLKKKLIPWEPLEGKIVK